MEEKQTPKKSLSAWALGLGLVSYLFALPGVAIPALICGHLHLSRSPKDSGQGRGVAIAGLVFAYLTWAVYLYAGNAWAIS